MTRNLDRRVEVTFPIYDSSIQQQLIDFLDVQWQDNVKARVLDEDLRNRYRPRVGKAVRAQTAFYERLRGPASDESKDKASA
jgi:polyphosphate kinase